MAAQAIVLALGSAACFGGIVFVQRRGLARTDRLTGAFLTIATAASLFWLGAPLMVERGWWLQPGTLWFAAMGLLFPAMAQQFQLASVVAVGPALTNSIGAFVPVFSATIAVAVLGESLNARGVAGLVVLVVALFLAPMASAGPARTWRFVALGLPLGAAAIRGIMQPVAKVGLQSVPSPYFAVLVMSSVSSLVLLALLTLRRRPWLRAAWGGHSGWFLLAGAIFGVGTLCLQGALHAGEVTTVAPVAATTPLWTVAFGALLYRAEIGPRQALLALAVCLGAALIVTR